MLTQQHCFTNEKGPLNIALFVLETSVFDTLERASSLARFRSAWLDSNALGETEVAGCQSTVG